MSLVNIGDPFPYYVPFQQLVYQYQPYNFFAPRGWICPRCDRINSPDIYQCPCSTQNLRLVPMPYSVVASSTTSYSINAGTCEVCGKSYIDIFDGKETKRTGFCICHRDDEQEAPEPTE